MKTNKLLDDFRKRYVTKETKRQVDIAVAIANKIYDTLDERGMSQKDFAALMGKTEAEVSRWLSGTHNLTIKTIASIETALGITLCHFDKKQEKFEVSTFLITIPSDGYEAGYSNCTNNINIAAA